MICIVPTNSLNDVKTLRQEYLLSIGGRPEPFLEELISYAASTYLLMHCDETIGYFCTSTKQTLLQFYMRDAYMPVAPAVFSDILAQGYIDKALILTRDRVALSLAMELHKQVAVDCYVFEEGPVHKDIQIGFADLGFRQASMDNVQAIRSACGDFHDFLHYTLEGSIEAGDIYALFSGDIVLASGVIAKPFEYPYVDIGMCVSEAYRRRSIGSFMISELLKECKRRGLVAGASCKYHNTASRKTLEKAGFIAKDRILRISF